MNLAQVSGRDALFIIGVPLAWAVLLLFHPGGEADQIYVELQDDVTRFLVVHVGMLIFIPLMAAAVYLLLRGIEGTAAMVSRIALVPFVVFYSAWEAVYGIGSGILADDVNGLSGSDQELGADLIQDFSENPLITNFGVFAVIGTIGLIVAMIAAGIALRSHAGAPLSVALLLGLSGFLITAHPPPFGPIGLVCFVVAVLLFWRSQSVAQATARSEQPASA